METSAHNRRVGSWSTRTTQYRPISPLPLTEIRIEGPLTLDFDGADGGIVDQEGQPIGFTMIAPVANSGNSGPIGGVLGYSSEPLDVDPITGVLKITTMPGLQYLNTNSLENALGVGLNVPSAAVTLTTTLVNLPTLVGGHAQAGFWFGGAGDGTESSQDDYIKLVVCADTANNYLVEALMEVNGEQTSRHLVDIPSNPFPLRYSAWIFRSGKPVQPVSMASWPRYRVSLLISSTRVKHGN